MCMNVGEVEWCVVSGSAWNGCSWHDGGGHHGKWSQMVWIVNKEGKKMRNEERKTKIEEQMGIIAWWKAAISFQLLVVWW